MVIGHELTHGFDDQGRKFDADGNLKDWWTPEDGKAFEERATCTADEYSGFVSVKDAQGDVKLNGRLTLGENTADNGGSKLAYMALMNIIGNTPVKPIMTATRRSNVSSSPTARFGVRTSPISRRASWLSSIHIRRVAGA